MAPTELTIDPYRHDPSHWGVSLVNNGELIVALLDAARAQSVVEVGAFAGDLTELLLDWAARSGGRVTAVDPAPQPDLVALEAARAELDLVRATSHDALARIPVPDAIVIDGDHNWWTVTGELRLIGERAAGAFPLVLFHDVCWPHARRDDYFDPELIPHEHRRPIAAGSSVVPDDPGTVEAGLPYRNPAANEGGPRNGVLTAVEDFVAARDDLRLAVVPAFFGLGVLWPADAVWADAVGELVVPLDRHPVLERLERNRVLHLVARQQEIARNAKLQRRLERCEELLGHMELSRTFAVGELLSRIARRGEPAYSKAQIRRLLNR